MSDNYDWNDAQFDEGHAASAGYPYIQWVTGDPRLAALHPVLGSGGFAMMQEQFATVAGGRSVDGWTPGNLTFGATTKEAMLAPSLSFSMLARRFRWEMQGSNGKKQPIGEYVAGARGRQHILAFVKGLEAAGPILLTLVGMSGKAFSDLAKEHVNSILSAAQSATSRRWPQYAFWMPVRAGQRISVGQGQRSSYITPPAPAWQMNGDSAARTTEARRLFVGQALLDMCAKRWDEAKAWREEWSRETIAAVVAAQDRTDEAEEPWGDEIPF